MLLLADWLPRGKGTIITFRHLPLAFALVVAIVGLCLPAPTLSMSSPAGPVKPNALKAAARKTISSVLSSIPPQEFERQGSIISDIIAGTAEYKSSRSVSCYLSTPKEISTSPIISRIFQDGKALYVPRLSKGVMQMVCVTTGRAGAVTSSVAPNDGCSGGTQQDVNQFPRDKWLIPTPPSSYATLAYSGEGSALTNPVDLIILPGAAFDPNNLNRLGHGKGYYDKYLDFIKSCVGENGSSDGGGGGQGRAALPYLIGTCMKEQLMKDLPAEDHDWKVDMIAVDSGESEIVL